MPKSSQSDQNRELEQLTSSIQEMATRINAVFVVDERKTENYLAAKLTGEPSQRRESGQPRESGRDSCVE